MKRILFSLILIVACISSYAKGYETNFSQPNSNEYQISFEITDWNLKNVVFDGVEFQKIIFNASTVTEEKGWAELPFISGSIQLPARKNVDLSIIYLDYTDYKLDYPLVPSRGVIYRNQDPSAIPYEIDPASIVDAFYPNNLAIAEEPFIIRDVRGTSVRVFPFQYNAATNTLRVYNRVDVLLTENDEPATNPLLTENLTPVREAIGMYQSLFLNPDATRFDLPMAQHGEILVVTTERDAETIDSYIQWKREKGFIVHKEIVSTGYSGSNIQSFIKNQYDNNNNILYVQIIGDWADIQSILVGGLPADPKLGCVVGTDNFPDIAIARFSCSNADQLNVQINKSIEYEKNPNMDPDWHESFIGIASNEGPGDDGEIDYTHIQRIYTQRLEPFSYSAHKQNYDPGANATNLTNHINAGASTIAYAGHGSQTSFVTTNYTNNNINQLSNGNKLPFITACACNTGEFNRSGGDCFAEAWLKKENGGAVAALLSSISQPWQPPMRGQDYFYDILIGGFDYSLYSGQNGLNTTEQRTTWGSIVVNTYNLMLTESSTSSDVETAHTWCSFGDATLQLRTKQPVQILSSMSTMMVGLPFNTVITANGNPVENAIVCISQDGVYISAITNENGEVSIENEFVPGEILLVVTAFNTATIYENIECVPAEGAYLIKDSYTLGENGILSFGETSPLSIAIKNVGVENTTTNTQVTITSDDPMLTIVSGTATYPPINSGEVANVENGFSISASEDITNGQNFAINITAVNGSNTWESKIYVNAYKPVLEYVNYEWPGGFEPGNTVQLAVYYKNKGGFNALNAVSTLSSTSSYINILDAEYHIGTIAPDGEVVAIYYVEIDEETPYTEVIEFEASLEASGNIIATGDFSISNSCNVIFDLADSYGDGWNGNKLSVSFSDGTPTQELTISSGPSASFTLEIMAGTDVTVTFITGQYTYECSFKIYYEGGNMIYQSSGTPSAGVATQFTCNCSFEVSTCEPVSNLAANTEDNNVILTWNSIEDASHFIVKCDGITIDTPTENTFIHENVSQGIHTYCIIAVYNSPSCESLPECISIEITDDVCSAPTGLAVEALNNSAILTWDHMACANSYNIYVDGDIIASGIVGTSYTDNDIYTGHICYYITAVNSVGESEPSVEACLEYTGINNYSNNATIYPNPTTGNLTIECKNMNQIKIYSLTGVLVYQTNIKANSHNINIDYLVKGTYLIQIIYNDGILTEKIVKQ
ncbi:MAG: C25 family cysteine peptidase [Bacteroidales bacterium]|jgi:gingipain R|nr:C25 family cysteine peptidase [Bacteroidales bacterium]